MSGGRPSAVDTKFPTAQMNKGTTTLPGIVDELGIEELATFEACAPSPND